ncbi:acyl-CoA-binding protein [Blyttiomyces helicus]|uniref:Acyl-CoA-binding protein n=1 Tax=Blyttiomyces helicus TaxID=388810 RepID=A0A4P9WFA7_9FUNG|nr:acyl-CoA-binding protein [Blyttiomyces helicus]|eukprot:RKO89988.1 acyl-CoA-binding protein [Blyttiomyces helicus]
MSDPASTGNAAFAQAAIDVKALTYKPSNDELLKLYALFKQGIVGDNETARPGMFDLQGKAKWDAWTAVKGTAKEAAQAQYIELVESLKAKSS